MTKQQFIQNKGLLSSKFDAEFSPKESYETIVNFLETIKQYRDYAKPNTPSWEEYILEVFHIFGFSSDRISPEVISLSEIGSEAASHVIVKLDMPNKNLFENPIIKWEEFLSKGCITFPVDWVITTNGFELRIVHLSKQVPLHNYLWANLEGIIEQGKYDSFFTLYKVLSYIRSSNLSLVANQPFSPLPRRISEPTINQDDDENSLLKAYVIKFTSLRTDVNHNRWSILTNFRAPHKPFLLLSIIDLYEQFILPANIIKISPELIKQFNKYWSVLGKSSGNIALPFFHLRSSAFWHLIAKPGEEDTLKNIRQVDRISQLNSFVLGAKLDPELDNFMQQEFQRDILRMSLIKTYFSPELFDSLSNLS